MPKEVTKKQLTELKRAYATGALRVRFADTDITYKSEAEMRRTIKSLERELGILTKPTFVNPRFSKGVS